MRLMMGPATDTSPDPAIDPGTPPTGEAPDHFWWRGRRWQVGEVVARWVETGAWWLRTPEQAPGASQLIDRREVWRVSACGRAGPPGSAVFDLVFDPVDAVWRLAGALD